MAALLPMQDYPVAELQAAYHRQLNLKEGYRFTVVHKASGRAVNGKSVAPYRPIDLTNRATIADVRNRFEHAYRREAYSCRIESHNHTPAPNTLVSNLERS